MAKKQTRRSISVSRLAYERLKSFCETSGISMSQFVESGINEKLDDAGASPTGASMGANGISTSGQTVTLTPIAPRSNLATLPPQRANLSTFTPRSAPAGMSHGPSASAMSSARPAQVPMTSAAARFAVEPPPPILRPRPVDHEPKPPAEPTPGQIFTF